MLKKIISQLRVLFIGCIIVYYVNDWVFPITTWYCAGDPDDVNVTIPGGIIRKAKQMVPEIAMSAKDLGVIAGVTAATKAASPGVKAGTLVAVFPANKVIELVNHVCKKHAIVEKSKIAALQNKPIETPSILEPDWLSNLMSNMSDAQILATCCAAFICLSLGTITVLVTWTIAREFANKAKSFMINYPKLNKVFLFYLKWGDLTSIPARILFVFLSLMNLSLYVYSLILLMDFY